MSKISTSGEETFKFISKALSDIYDKIDSISESLVTLNNSIEDLRTSLKTNSEDFTKKIDDLEKDNENLRKVLIEKVTTLENDMLENLKEALSAISLKKNQEFISELNTLFTQLKNISWLAEISSLGMVVAKKLSQYYK
ncbi:MAG: hypothetical protein ACTSQY_07120 [Candidatus Odinarchaeia archaeon]